MAEAREHYAAMFARMSQFSPSEYFLQVDRAYHQEQKIVFECFGINSQSLINKAFADVFLEGYRGRLVEGAKGLKFILENREAGTVRIITELYKQLTGSIEGFKDPFEAFVFEEFTRLMKEVSTELLLRKSVGLFVGFIQKVIKMSNELVDILETSFMKYSEFINYFKNGVERAFSKNPLQVSVEEMLSVYIDAKLKGAFPTQDELTDEVRNMVNIFACLENKDLFLLRYLQKLARKILTLSPDGLANHEHFVYQLKLHSGNKFTERVETMIDEFKLSLEQDEEYRGVCVGFNLPYSMNLRIFSEGSWPFVDHIDFQEEQLYGVMRSGFQCCRAYQHDFVKKRTLKFSYLESRVRWVYYFDEAVQNKNPQCYFDTNGVQAILLLHVYNLRPEPVHFRLLAETYPQIKPTLMRKVLGQMSECAEPMLIKTCLGGEMCEEGQEEEVAYQFNRLLRSKKRIIQYDTAAEYEGE